MNIALAALLLVVIVYFLIRRKSANTATEVIADEPDTHQPLLEQHVAYYTKLDEAGKAKFEAKVNNFLQYVHIEGVGGGRRQCSASSKKEECDGAECRGGFACFEDGGGWVKTVGSGGCEDHEECETGFG